MTPRFVYGNLNKDGSIAGKGSGDWVPTHDDTGEYTIVFTPAFKTTPTVVSLQNYPDWSDFGSDGGVPTDNSVLIAVDNQKCKLLTGDSAKPTATRSNRNLCFLVVGQ